MQKKSFTPHARPLACSALAMFIALPVSALASSFDLTGGTTTSQQTLLDGESGVVQSGASLITSTPITSSLLVSGNAAGITNSGTISSIDNTAIKVDALMSGSLVNNGSIAGPTAIGITSNGDVAGGIINNAGATISGSTGIYASGDHSGSITNSGTISATQNGINIQGAWTGAITNQAGGLIESSSGSGIYVSGGVTGNISNSGTINGYWGGIVVDSRAGLTTANGVSYAVNGDVTNSGTITSSSGQGIDVYGNLIGNITNSGSITSAYTGIYVSGDVSGNVTNSGTITTQSDSGIYVRGNVGGSVNNSGSIASSYSGIYVGSGVAGDVTNSGTIKSKWGSGIDVSGGVSGNVTNSGTINSYYSGIYVYGDVGGSVTNSGSITSMDDGGIDIYGNVAGDITNTASGVINSSWDGIYANSVGGSITNSGSITSQWDRGIGVNYHWRDARNDPNAGVTGSITNSGTITSSSTGIYVSGNVGGSITNSGTISSRGDYGIYVDSNYYVANTGNVGGSITNSGTINSYYSGIYVRGNVGGDVTNSGSITSQWDLGIDVDGNVGGSVSNSGTIKSSSSGIYIGGDVGGNVTNSGTITSRDYDGLYLDGNVAGNITNSGTITSYSTGITARGTVGGDVINTGSITSQWDNGIELGNWYSSSATGVAGNITNSGTINSSYTGISVSGNVGGSITNSGTINSRDDDGIYVGYNWYSGVVPNTGNVGGDISNTASGVINSYYTGIGVYGDVGGSITNDGTISSVWGSGIYVGGNVTGNVTNNGTINSYYSGIYVSGDVGGSVTNSGSITALDDGGIDIYGNVAGDISNTASGVINSTWDGIYASGNVGGSVTNSGTITSLWGNGISIGDFWASTASGATGVTGNVTNSGTITSSSTGIYVSGNVGGSISNSGTITSRGSDGIYVGRNYWIANTGNVGGDISNSGTVNSYYTGIGVDGDVGGSITNDGTISSVWGSGIYVNGNVAGSITNSGSINSYYTGIYVGGDVGGNITNSGTITTYDYDGISVNGTLSGDLLNSGTITAGSDGIQLGYISAGSTVTNSGTINASSYGIYNYNGSAGTIINSGSIEARGVGIDSESNVSGDTTTIINSGSITSGSTGIYVSGAAGSSYAITNSGTINARNGKSDAISGGEGAMNGTLTNSGTIIGNVVMGSGDDTVNLNDGGTISGSIDGGGQVNADTLNFNTNGYVVGGDISNFEAVNLNSGMTDLNGYSIINGTDVTIASGAGLIVSDGSVGANVANNGTLELSGTNTVSGDYTQGAGGTLQTVVVNSTTAGNASVTGTADLANGQVVAHVNATDYIANGSSYDVLTAGTLTNSNVSVSDTSAVLDFTPTVTGNTLTLTADRVATYQGVVGSGFGLAGQLDAVAASGTFTPAQSALLGQLDSAPDAQSMAKLLADVSPDSTGAALEGSRDVTTQVATMVNQRIDNQLAKANGTSGLAAGDAFRDSAVWMQGFTGNSKQDGSLGNNGYDGKNHGFVIGADTAVGSGSRVGISLATTKNNLDVASGVVGDTLDIKSNHVTVYGSYDGGSWNLAGMVASSKHDFSSLRNGVNSASYNGSQLSMMVEAGYPVKMGGVNVMPLVSFSHSALNLDGYTETGPGALTVQSATYTSNELGVGARVSKEIASGNHTWVPRASLRYKHEGGDVNQESNATLNSAGISFATTGTERKRGTLELGLGMDVLSGDRFAVQADYQRDQRSDYKANTFRLSLRYKF